MPLGERINLARHRPLRRHVDCYPENVLPYVRTSHLNSCVGDGVLVDTEFWYYKAGERALADIGLTLDKDRYLRDMNLGMGTWVQARAAGPAIAVFDPAAR